MIAYKLTIAQKDQLIGVEFIKDCFYNPVEDGNSNWIISIEEVEQTTNENFMWVKDLPLITYKPVIINGE